MTTTKLDQRLRDAKVPTERITIVVEKKGSLYFAYAYGEGCEFQGTSPDEAIGWLIRERILAGDPFIVQGLDCRYE